MPDSLHILIASSNPRFGGRYMMACKQSELAVSLAHDGFEALTRLEQGIIDMLLVDGGFPGSVDGLKGIAGDELAHMWRQIEGRGNHLVIGYVSEREALPADDDSAVDNIVARAARHSVVLARMSGCENPAPEGRSRFFIDPAHVVANRGVDYHFWSDDNEDQVVQKLVQSVRSARAALARQVEVSKDPRISRIGDHKPTTG